MIRFVLLLLLLTPILANAQTTKELRRSAYQDAESGRIKEATEKFVKLVQSEEAVASDYAALGYILQNIESYKNALDVYNYGIEAFPDSSIVYIRKGVLLYNAGAHTDAIEVYTKALSLESDPDTRAHILLNRGSCYNSIRKFEEAAADYQLIYLQDSSDVDMLTNYSIVVAELGRYDDALVYLTRANRIEPENAAVINNLGFLHQYLDQHQKAIVYFDKQLELEPHSALAYSNRGYSKLHLGDLDGALKDVNASLNRLPDNSYAYCTKGMILQAQGDDDNACIAWNMAEQLGYTREHGDKVEKLLKEHCVK